jgi:2-oxoglutarate/2-oxoacid ferredoxin oxidoreductase subunit alpha
MSQTVSLSINDEVSIVLCGPAGSGIQTVEHLLVRMFKDAGFHVFATKEYMSRVRGGYNSVTIRVASHPVRAAVDRMDVLIPLNPGAIAHVQDRLTAETLILADPGVLGDEATAATSNVYPVEWTQIAKDLGNKLFSNIIAVGVVGALLKVDPAAMETLIRSRFEGRGDDIIDGNLRAVDKGRQIGDTLAGLTSVTVTLSPDVAVRDQILISGVEAIGLGAIAANCRFIGAYPMSPSTGLLEFLAQHGEAFEIVVEQAEDEIAGINMAIGAWYAGTRAIASTSGGGFALMTEGLSLAGMMESPLVIHLAQRPGPATGLPTRTGQEDLNLALYAGHGEFPRVILAPGTLQEGFDLTVKAFDWADRYQVPVFILTDQSFMDSFYNTDRLDVAAVRNESHVVETTAEYRRFELTDNGLSPRGIPGHGRGLVVADSDEHDEAGHITEDLRLRRKMVDKRLMRMKLLEAVVPEPTLWPNADYQILILCWGSTLPVVQEALTLLDRDDLSLMHFSQVYPLPADLGDRLEQADRIICLEGNATGQFAGLVAAYAGFNVDDCLLKYNGLPFTAEETAESILDHLEHLEAD